MVKRIYLNKNVIITTGYEYILKILLHVPQICGTTLKTLKNPFIFFIYSHLSDGQIPNIFG